MLNYSVVSFYDNFGLIFKGPEDNLDDERHWKLVATHPRERILASVRVNLVARNYSLWRIFLLLAAWRIFVHFRIVFFPKARQKNLVKPTTKVNV